MPAIAKMSEVAETILDQIEVNKLSAMIGVSSVGHSENSVQVRFKARAKDGINLFKITLDPSDTYTVSFYRVTKNGATLKGSFEDIYCDQLIDLIEDKTGLACRLASSVHRLPVVKPIEAPKKPKWIGEWLDNGNQALVGIIGKQLNWDITQARALVVEILQDVNDHDAAEKVNDLLQKIFDGEEG